jgi:hypothetical protein
MSKAEGGHSSKNLGLKRLKEIGIKDRKVLRHPFSRTSPKKINKVNHPKIIKRLQINLGKGQGSNLYNVGDVREITYIGASLTKVKEWRLPQHSGG